MGKKQFVIEHNHLIILAKEKQATADFLTSLLELPAAIPADGPVPNFFLCVQFTNRVMVLIAEAKEHNVGHYAFRVEYHHFQRILERLEVKKVQYWADPRMQRPMETYQENGNRGFYVIDPSGHGIEVMSNIHAPE